MLPVIGIVASLAVGVGFAFILSRTVPSMPNKVCRFFFLFVLCVPFNFVISSINTWAFGYHKIRRPEDIIIALLLAAFWTLLPPQQHNSNTPYSAKSPLPHFALLDDRPGSLSRAWSAITRRSPSA
jgi:hypothetical protein